MALDVDVRRLGKIPLLAQIDPEALRLIAFSADTRHLAAGETLFSTDEVSSGGFLVVSGTIELRSSDKCDPPVAGPGSLIGELALITETRQPVDAVAREPTVVMAISRKLFRRVLHEFPSSAARLQATIESRLRSFTAATRTGVA